MFCPKCSQPVLNDGTQFCSKCGFSTVNVKSFLDNNGKINEESKNSADQKGIRQGAKLLLLSLILLPIYILLAPMFPANDVLVESSPSDTWFEQISLAVIWTTFFAGLARIAFAVVFERKNRISGIEYKAVKQVNAGKINDALPPMRDVPISNFGNWKITDELLEPISVKRKTSGNLK